MQQILLEDVYEFDNSVVPIVIFDLRVHLFSILESYNRHKERLMLNRELAHEWFVAKWAYKLNRPIPWLANQPAKGWYVIVVDDYKRSDGTYWRNDYVLAENLPRYKGNRNIADRPEAYSLIHQSVLNYLDSPECPIPLFREEGFEADDWAGVAYRQTDGKQPIFLYTVDNDWLQLADDDKQVLFACTKSYKPRLRTEYEALRWAHGKGWLLTSPKQIADKKAIYGDEGDNLMPGSPIGVIDLIEPSLLPSESERQRLGKCLSPKYSNTSEKHAQAAYDWLLRHDLA